MYISDEFSTKLVLAVFSLYLFKIGKVNNADILDFWVRDPTFDNRGPNDKSNKNLTDNQQNFRHYQSRTRDKVSTDRHNRDDRQGEQGIDQNSDGGYGYSMSNQKTRNRDPQADQLDRTYSDQDSNHIRDDKPNWHQGHDDQKRSEIRHDGRRKNINYKKAKLKRHLLKTMKRNNFLRESNKTEEEEEEGEIYEMLNPYIITEQMHVIMAYFPGANVTHEIIGRTFAHKDILLLKITSSPNSIGNFRGQESKYVDDDVPEKKIFFIVHGLSVMGMSQISCLSYNHDLMMLVTDYVAQLDAFDIFFLPLANPDGYAHSSTVWNKNMSPQSACAGVALDRNFDVAWNLSRKVSSCSQQYPGPSPFSEAETRAIREVFHRYSHKIIAYLHVHGGTYDAKDFKGEAVLYPKGYTDVQTDDDKYQDLKGKIDEAMRNASFKVMSVTVDSLYNWYGRVAGTSVDYADTVYGIPYAMELVMQVYHHEAPWYNMMQEYALDEIWSRVIDVIFDHIRLFE